MLSNNKEESATKFIKYLKTTLKFVGSIIKLKNFSHKKLKLLINEVETSYKDIKKPSDVLIIYLHIINLFRLQLRHT
jgi:hypothetical protein